MDTIFSVAAVIGTLGLLFSAINLIYPIKRLGITTRNRVAVVLVLSLGLLAVVGAFINSEKQFDQTSRNDVKTSEDSALVRSEQRIDETENLSGHTTPRDNGGVSSVSNARKTNETASSSTAADREAYGNVGVVSDRFILQWDLDGNDLLLKIDTDLPDTAEVNVSVGRRYYEVGNTETYSRYYFEGKGLMSEWRTPRRVPINDKRWKADLKAFQAKMARLSSELAFTIDRIEDQIVARAVVHMNQPDPRFGGHGNPNLFGAAVSRRAGRNDLNLIEDQKEIELPLAGMRPAKEAKNVPYDGLMTGESYRLPTKTPLMAASPRSVSNSNFEETMEAIGKTLYIPAGRVVRVLSIDRSSRLNPRYEVEVIGNERATGWINSTALMRSGVVLE